MLPRKKHSLLVPVRMHDIITTRREVDSVYKTTRANQLRNAYDYIDLHAAISHYMPEQ